MPNNETPLGVALPPVPGCEIPKAEKLLPEHPGAGLGEGWTMQEMDLIEAYGLACAKAVEDDLDSKLQAASARIAELESNLAMMGGHNAYREAKISELEKQLEAKGAEVEALRAGIEKALVEIDDAGPKALKYARQELDAARSPHPTE